MSDSPPPSTTAEPATAAPATAPASEGSVWSWVGAALLGAVLGAVVGTLVFALLLLLAAMAQPYLIFLFLGWPYAAVFGALCGLIRVLVRRL